MHTFSDPTIHMYISLFESIINVERMAESIRQRLVRRLNFSMQQAFQTMDFNSDGYVTVSDVSNIKNATFFQIASLMVEYGYQKPKTEEV